jgi:uncharacterized membrane protein (UPF0127 family)
MFVKINDTSLKVVTCITQKSKQKGMMGMRFKDFEGMLFFMGSGNHCFYMKNCIIPLDIIFINSNLEIVEILENCPPCHDDECEHYCSNGNFVLEVPGGFCSNNNFSIGDTCHFIVD